jgi:hypothetical protein
LKKELRDLHAEAGYPSVEEVAKDLPFPQKVVRGLLESVLDFTQRWNELELIVEKLARMANKEDVQYWWVSGTRSQYESGISRRFAR